MLTMDEMTTLHVCQKAPSWQQTHIIITIIISLLWFYFPSTFLLWFILTPLVSIVCRHSRQLFFTEKALKPTVHYLPSMKTDKVSNYLVNIMKHLAVKEQDSFEVVGEEKQELKEKNTRLTFNKQPENPSIHWLNQTKFKC